MIKKWWFKTLCIALIIAIGSYAVYDSFFALKITIFDNVVSIGIRSAYAAVGDTTQVIFGGTSDDPTVGATEYAGLMGMGVYAWGTTENAVTGVIPTGGTLTNFKVGVKTAPGSTKTWTFTIRVGNPPSDSALSVTITNSNTLSALDTDTVAVTAGQLVSLSAVSTAGSTAAGAVYWTVEFKPTVQGETILLTNATASATSGTFYIVPIGCKIDATEFEGESLFPCAGTLKNLYVNLSAAPNGGNSRIYTVRQNETTDTALGVTITGSATTGNDTSDTVSVSAGDRITIKNTFGGTPLTGIPSIGMVFLPSTSGNFITCATSDDATSSAQVEYEHLACGDSTLTTTENEQYNLARACTAKALYVNLSTGSGSGNTWTFSLRQNTGTPSPTITVSITNGTSGNTSQDVAIANDDVLDTLIDARAGAATSSSQIAYLFYLAPEAGAPAITVSPTSYDFQIVYAGVDEQTTTTYFTIDNTSGIQTDQTISVTTSTWAGGVTWTHSDTATAGANQAGLLSNKGGTWGVGDIIVKYSSPNYIAENQAASTDYSFGLKLIAPTSFTDGVQKTIIVRITAAAG